VQNNNVTWSNCHYETSCGGHVVPVWRGSVQGVDCIVHVVDSQSAPGPRRGNAFLRAALGLGDERDALVFAKKCGPLILIDEELPISRDGRASWQNVRRKWGESVTNADVWRSHIVRFDEIKMGASKRPEKEIRKTPFQGGLRTTELSKQWAILAADFYATPIDAYLDAGRLVKACVGFPKAWREGDHDKVAACAYQLDLIYKRHYRPETLRDYLAAPPQDLGRSFEEKLRDLAVEARISPSISLGPLGPGAGEVSEWGRASVWAHVVEGLFLNATSSKPIPARPMTDTERSNLRTQRERENKPFRTDPCVGCGKYFKTQDRRRRRCGSRCGLE
jgi:hypothetical protein